MKRIFLLIPAIFFVILSLTACGVKTEVPEAHRKSDTASYAVKTDDSLEKIIENGKIIVGIDIDDSNLPFVFRDENNEIVGFDIDMARAAADTIGIEIEFKTVSWENMIDELNDYSIDLIWSGFTVTEEYEEQVLFSRPYLKNRQVITVLKELKYDDVKNLANKKIGIQSGSIAENDTYEIIDNASVINYSNVEDAMLDLEAGKIDALVQDEVLCKYYSNKKSDVYCILDFFDEYEDEYAIGARLADKSFMMEVDTALQTIVDNKTAAEISLKWFGKDIVKQ